MRLPKVDRPCCLCRYSTLSVFLEGTDLVETMISLPVSTVLARTLPMCHPSDSKLVFEVLAQRV